MSLPSEADSEPCLALTNGNAFIIKHKLIKNSEGKDLLYTWTKEERRCKYCNKLLNDENDWILFTVNFIDSENVPKLKDGTIPEKAIVWSCRKKHLIELAFMTSFGDTISRIPNLQVLCAIKLFRKSYSPGDFEIPDDIKERYIRASSTTKQLKEYEYLITLTTLLP